MDWFDDTEAGWYDTAFWSENTNECDFMILDLTFLWKSAQTCK